MLFQLFTSNIHYETKQERVWNVIYLFTVVPFIGMFALLYRHESVHV